MLKEIQNHLTATFQPRLALVIKLNEEVYESTGNHKRDDLVFFCVSLQKRMLKQPDLKLILNKSQD